MLLLCVKCGSENPDGAVCCSKCGAATPRALQQARVTTDDTPKVNERLQLFEQAVEGVLSNQWDAEKFASFLHNMAEILAEKEQDIRSIVIPEEAADDFREELDIGYQGIALYNRGLDTMFAYLEDPQPIYLGQGLALVRQGNEAINEAMRLNRENRSKLEEEMYNDPSNIV